jgi:GTPase SAR1 family protein
MWVAENIPDSDIEGPMFVSSDAFKIIRLFVEVPEPNNPLVLVGPPKCGKSAVLNHVIPSMVAQYSTDLEPIFVRFQFKLTEPPAKAIESLMTALFHIGAIFKLDLAEVTTNFRANPSDVSFVCDVVYQMALKFEETHHKRLWLLLDECQVRGDAALIVVFGQFPLYSRVTVCEICSGSDCEF